MIQSLFIGLALLGTVFNFVKAPDSYLDYDWKNPPLSFGAITYPSSLDVFENPSATQNVATAVSHSTHHGNANDALEAIEAKVGVTASTPVTGSVLAGNGTGSSLWTTYGTTTNFQSTNFVATGSSTLQNFTFVNATGTSATTTNFFSTTASSTTFNSSTISGAGLITCTGSNFLQWTGGTFACVAASTSGITVVSTTSVANMSTTTLRNIPFGENLHIRLKVASTSNQAIRMCFNEDWGGCKLTHPVYQYGNVANGAELGSGTGDDQPHILLNNNGPATPYGMVMTFDFFLSNSTTSTKVGNGLGNFATTTASQSYATQHNITWASTTAAINSVSFVINDTSVGNYLGAGTLIKAYVSD